jgi:hypothetical protein
MHSITRRLNRANIVKNLEILEPEAGTPPAVARVAPREACSKSFMSCWKMAAWT